MWEKIQEFITNLGDDPDSALILIDGPAGSGKTTLAKQIADRYSANLLHMDDFYLGWNEPLDSNLYDRVQQALNHLANPVQNPSFQVFNWVERTFQPRTQPSLGKVTVVEGVGSFGLSQPTTSSLKIWISAESQTCYDRVLDRDGLDFAELIRQWQVHEKDYFERTNAAAKADLLLQT